mmetsp:Transcript_41956/g.98324  ORF Transcript_41956/g.98324 Transcript_41956/m.98324 type:complete len:423 (-) Transcript_41956:713-1981(-)
MKQIDHGWDNQCSSNKNVVSKTKLTSIMLMIGNLLPDFGYSLQSMESKVEMGHAFTLLGVTWQSFALWHESLECFNNALKIFQSIDLDENHPYIISTMKHIDVFAVLPVFLVPVTSQYCIKLKYAKKFNEYDYGPSGLPLELSSHPGKGILSTCDFLGPQTNSRLCKNFVGIGPKEGSVCVIREGNLLRWSKTNQTLRCFLQFISGSPLVWDDSEEQATQKGEWIIRDDKIASLQAPHLCVGTTPQCHLHLVPRDSRNRLVFENHVELRESQNQIIPKDRKGIPLTLSSHPNCCIIYRSFDPIIDIKSHPTIDIKSITVASLFIGGPLESSALARFSKNGELVLDEHGGLVMRTVFNILSEGIAVTGTRDNCDQPRLGQPFQVNDDGSISPVEAPHFVLGFPELFRTTVGLSNKTKAVIKAS